MAAFAPFALYGPALGLASAVPDMDVTAPGTLTASALADAVAAVRATVVFASPAALRNVVRHGRRPHRRAPRGALAGVRLLMSAGAPVPAALLQAVRDLLPHADPHTPYGMTEVLPVADISLSELEAAGPRQRRLRRAAGPRRHGGGEPARRPTAPARATRSPTAGLTGEICVRAAHVKDRYDRLWATERASARDRRLAPHRRRRPPRRRRAGCGWRAGWCTSSPPRTARSPRSASSSASRRSPRSRPPRASASVLPGRSRSWWSSCPSGDRATAAGAGRRPTWPPPCASRRGGPRRGGARHPRPAGRHPARLQGRPRRGRPLGRPGAGRRTGRAPVRVLVTGASGMLGAGVARALHAARRRRDRAAAAPLGAARCARSSPTSPTAAAVAGAARGQDAVVHLAAKVDVTGAWADYEHANIDGTALGRRACRAGGVGRLVHVSSPSVAHAGSALVGVGAGPGRPRRARGHYARSKAVAELLALRADGAGPGRRSPSARTWCGAPATPSSSRGWCSAPAPGGCRWSAPAPPSSTAPTWTTRSTPSSPPSTAASAARGEALVVSNGEPRPVAELIAGICRAAGAPPPRRQVPYAVALGRRRRRRRRLGDPARAARRRAGRPAADPFPRRAAGHGALVRPAAHPRGCSPGRPRVSLDEGLAALSRAWATRRPPPAPADRARSRCAPVWGRPAWGRPAWGRPVWGRPCAVPAPGPDLCPRGSRASVGA